MNNDAYLFYFPALHRERLPRHIGASFSFIPSGLPASAPRTPAEAAFAEALPLSGAEAKDALNQLLALGADHAERLKEFAAAAHAPRPADDEFRALAAFAAGGTLPEGPRAPKWGAARTEPSEEDIRAGLVECQKVLLLAHALETDLMEAEALAARVRGAGDGLMAALGEGAASDKGDDAEDFAALATQTGLSAPEAPPWRLVVEAALPFLPENSVLFTADPKTAAELLETGMLHPLPEDKAALCPELSAETTSRLLWTRVPAIRLTSRRGPDPRRPWLERTVEVLVLRPSLSDKGAA